MHIYRIFYVFQRAGSSPIFCYSEVKFEKLWRFIWNSPEIGRLISGERFTSERNLGRPRVKKSAQTFQFAGSRNPSKGNQRRTNIIARLKALA